MNATGGWTAIDSELSSTSTNPVKNSTLYGLETYHKLTLKNDTYYVIDDDNFEVLENTSIKIFVSQELQGKDDILIKSKGHTPKFVRTTIGKDYTKTFNSNNVTTNSLTKLVKYFHPFYVKNNNIGNLDNGYDCMFCTGDTVIELLLTSDEGWIIVGDPIVGRITKEVRYQASTFWNITSNAIVYASGLKIQWGNFTIHSASEEAVQETYFPVKFTQKPAMSFTFDTNVGSGALDADVVHRDTPYAYDNTRWKLYTAAEGTYGYWQAIGY